MITSEYPALVAGMPEPYTDLLPDIPARTEAAQSWRAGIASAKYHWYDLIAGFPETPNILDPVGRYIRRMQFDLEAAAEKRLIYFVINRPRVRFDAKRGTKWGFFSSNHLTIPLLLGADARPSAITITLKMPFAATLKKPGVILSENFLTLNWGGLVEALSVHDVLRDYEHDLKCPGSVLYVGQTRDPAGLLAKGRLPIVQKLQQQHSDEQDTLLLMQDWLVDVTSDDGDPAELPANQNPVAADALKRDRTDLIEAALIRYFEDPAARHHGKDETALRNARLREILAANHLEQLTLDLQLEDAGNYAALGSGLAAPAERHLASCRIEEGEAQVTRLPAPAPPAA